MAQISGTLKNIRGQFKVNKLVVFIIAIGILVIWLYPMILSLVTALKTETEILQSPLALPKHPSLAAFFKTWELLNFGTLIRNSFIIASGSVIIGIALSSIPAYAFSRFQIPGGELIFILLLTGMMLPQQTVIIPLYDILRRLGLLDNLFGLMLVHAAYGMPFNMLVLRGFMASIPIELESAARVDGCSDFGVYRYIILPLVIPAVAVAGTLNFINIWNEFFFAIILLNSQNNFPVTVGMITVQQSRYFSSWNTPAAALIMAQLPTILLYILAHRYITEGILAGAVKG
jgi:ABC-type glycerol-3-phosphate transport system permease component